MWCWLCWLCLPLACFACLAVGLASDLGFDPWKDVSVPVGFDLTGTDARVLVCLCVCVFRLGFDPWRWAYTHVDTHGSLCGAWVRCASAAALVACVRYLDVRGSSHLGSSVQHGVCVCVGFGPRPLRPPRRVSGRLQPLCAAASRQNSAGRRRRDGGYLGRLLGAVPEALVLICCFFGSWLVRWWVDPLRRPILAVVVEVGC